MLSNAEQCCAMIGDWTDNSRAAVLNPAELPEPESDFLTKTHVF